MVRPTGGKKNDARMKSTPVKLKGKAQGAGGEGTTFQEPLKGPARRGGRALKKVVPKRGEKKLGLSGESD